MPDVKKELHGSYHPVIAGIRRLPKPVVASVNGPAVGIGASLAFACDLVLAAESAFFGLAFVNIGLMPDGGSTLFVPAAVGKARAFQMALLGERVPAETALDWGLVNWVHPDDRLMEQAESLTARLAAKTRSLASVAMVALEPLLSPLPKGERACPGPDPGSAAEGRRVRRLGSLGLSNGPIPLTPSLSPPGEGGDCSSLRVD